MGVASLSKLESLYLQALRVITGLPHHTKIEELYRYCQLPPLHKIVTHRTQTDHDRRLLTPQGQRLLELDDRSFKATAFEPTIPPWEDVRVKK